MIINQISMRHENQFFAEISGMFRRHNGLVSNEIIKKIRAAGSRITQPCQLHRRRAKCTNIQPVIFGMPHQINENIHAIVINALCGFPIIHSPDVNKLIAFMLYPSAVITPIIRTVRIDKNIKFPAMMKTKQSAGQMPHRVIEKIIGQIRNRDFPLLRGGRGCACPSRLKAEAGSDMSRRFCDLFCP